LQHGASVESAGRGQSDDFKPGIEQQHAQRDGVVGPHVAVNDYFLSHFLPTNADFSAEKRDSRTWPTRKQGKNSICGPLGHDVALKFYNSGNQEEKREITPACLARAGLWQASRRIVA